MSMHVYIHKGIYNSIVFNVDAFEVLVFAKNFLKSSLREETPMARKPNSNKRPIPIVRMFYRSDAT